MRYSQSALPRDLPTKLSTLFRILLNKSTSIDELEVANCGLTDIVAVNQPTFVIIYSTENTEVEFPQAGPPLLVDG